MSRYCFEHSSEQSSNLNLGATHGSHFTCGAVTDLRLVPLHPPLLGEVYSVLCCYVSSVFSGQRRKHHGMRLIAMFPFSGSQKSHEAVDTVPSRHALADSGRLFALGPWPLHDETVLEVSKNATLNREHDARDRWLESAACAYLIRSV